MERCGGLWGPYNLQRPRYRGFIRSFAARLLPGGRRGSRDCCGPGPLQTPDWYPLRGDGFPRSRGDGIPCGTSRRISRLNKLYRLGPRCNEEEVMKEGEEEEEVEGKEEEGEEAGGRASMLQSWLIVL